MSRPESLVIHGKFVICNIKTEIFYFSFNFSPILAGKSYGTRFFVVDKD